MDKKRLIEKEDYAEAIKDKNAIVIYGAGRIAYAIIQFMNMQRIDLAKIYCLAVTDKHNNPDNIMGIPVCLIDDINPAEIDIVIVAAFEKNHDMIANKLEGLGFGSACMISNILYAKLRKSAGDFDVDILNNTQWIRDDLVRTEERIKNIISKERRIILDEINKTIDKTEKIISKITPHPYIEKLVVNICDHCNLNCAGCDHFSPIADEKFYDVEEIVKQMTKLREIIGSSILAISVMGGEPLLHPKLLDILSEIRMLFPDTRLCIYTNGILLLKRDSAFWNTLKKLTVELVVTKYPIKFNYDEISTVAASASVNLEFSNGANIEKTMGHFPLDLSGRMNPKDSFMNCYHANGKCVMLQNGKLYTCTIAPCIPIFNKRYGVNIPLTEDDGIDIFSGLDKQELFRRLSEPMPVCRFCDVRNRTFDHEWKQSTGDISEWT